MKEIGGYFSLELSEGGNCYHHTGYKFKSGRSSLAFILQQLRPRKVYVPFYTCDALLEPFIRWDVSFSFYSINTNLEIIDMPHLFTDELIIYINYFDIKQDYVQTLSDIYQEQLVVDCTQSYFLKGNDKSWFFNSSRKFFGVPDGSDLYVPKRFDFSAAYSEINTNTNFLVDHLILRFNEQTQKGYEYFKKNEQLNDSGQSKMSKLSSSLLSNVDYSAVIETRKSNFKYLHDKLKNLNKLDICDVVGVSAFYPYLPASPIDKKLFWQQGIFLPSLWLDCINRPVKNTYEVERNISQNLLPLPVDHRYTNEDMARIIELILTHYHRYGIPN